MSITRFGAPSIVSDVPHLSPLANDRSSCAKGASLSVGLELLADRSTSLHDSSIIIVAEDQKQGGWLLLLCRDLERGLCIDNPTFLRLTTLVPSTQTTFNQYV